MDANEREMREINPERPPAPLPEEAREEIAALARRQRRANSLLMRLVNFAGSQVEDGMKLLPRGVRTQVEESTRTALLQSYEIAHRSRGPGTFGRLGGRVTTDRAHKVLATVSGALGGLGGLPTALAELPVAITVIFRAVQGVAEENGEDPLSAETRLEVLRVFGAGGDPDSGIDTSFLGARLGLTGAAVHTLISRVAPRFATVLSQKLATQTVPILGAAAGAGTNYAFIDYYVEIAHVHFALRRLVRAHGEGPVLDHFHKVLAEGRAPVNRA